MNVQLRVIVDGNIEFIELYGNENITLEVSFAEIQDITKKNSAYTKEFNVPGSKNNNYIFNYFFDFNQVPLDWTPTKKFEAELMYNGYIIASGYIRLNSVTVTGLEKQYNITFYNGVGDISANIGDKFMRQLDLTSLSHPFTSNVYLQSQIDYNLFNLTGGTNYSYQNGKTYWGLFNIGYNYTTSTSGISQYYTSTSTTSFTIDGINKTLVTQTNRAWAPGDRIKATYDASNWIEGVVLSYSNTTGTLTFDPDKALGTGTYSSWTLTLELPEGSEITDALTTPKLLFGLRNNIPNYMSFSGTPIRSYYFKPSIQIKELYTQIVEQAGYKIESNFFNTSYFERYYLPLKFLDESVYTKGAVQPCYSFTGDCVGSPCLDTTYDGTYYLANTVSAATCNNIPFTATTTGFTIPAAYAGDYTFQIQTVFNLESDEFNGASFGGGLRINGTDYFFLNASQAAGAGINSISDTSLFPFTVTGDTTISLFYDPSFNSFLTSFSFSIYIAPRVILGNFDYASEFPENDFKQIDFITSINKLFNLVVIPSPTKQKTLIIEPMIDYIGKGEILDWTEKIDFSSPITIQPITNFVNGTLNYNFKLDQDQVNQQFNIAANRIFGTYQLQLNQDFKDNNINFDTIFGSPTDVPVNNNNLPTITLNSMASLKTSEVQGQPIQRFNPYKILPRVIFRGPTLPNTNWTVPSTAETQTWWAESTQIDRWQSNNRFNTYPFSYTGFSHYINFNSSDSYNSTESTFPSQQDMYDIYYYDYISDITSPENKSITMKAYLTPWEVTSLSFNEKIFIKNNYYRINKISGLNLTEPSLCNLEVVKLTKSYTSHPVKYFSLSSCTSGSLYTSTDLNYNLYAYVGKYVKIYDDTNSYLGCYLVQNDIPRYDVDYYHYYLGSGYTSSGVGVYDDCGCTGATSFTLVQENYS